MLAPLKTDIILIHGALQLIASQRLLKHEFSVAKIVEKAEHFAQITGRTNAPKFLS
jgi:hypothetical protein